MIKCADRIKNEKSYYFATKLAEIAKMNADGLDVINLGIGSPDMPPPKEVIETLHSTSSHPDNHGYQPYRGTLELRKAYAQWYKKNFDVDLSHENEILPLMGSKEGIMHISMSFLNPGDQVLVPDPGYPSYTSATRIAGGDILTYDLKEEDNWLPDFDAIERNDLSKVKLMWVNYPHMPTGAKGHPSLFKSLISFAERHNILICHDNPYNFILNDHPMSIMQFPHAKDHCLELTSHSKGYNMAGWRVGCVVGDAAYLAHVMTFKSNMDSGMYKPVQLAAVQALETGSEWYDSLNEVYLKRKKIAKKIMDLLGIKYADDSAGLFLWGKITDDTLSGSLSDKILKHAHVFITPGMIFGKNGDRYMRISLCTNEAGLEAAFQRISTHLKKIKK